MAETLTVVAAGSGEIKDITNEPRTVAGDILRETGLQGYVLSKRAIESSSGEKENAHPMVNRGEEFCASAPVGGGRVMTAHKAAQIGPL